MEEIEIVRENRVMRLALEAIRDTPTPKKPLDAVVALGTMKDRAILALYIPPHSEKLVQCWVDSKYLKAFATTLLEAIKEENLDIDETIATLESWRDNQLRPTPCLK